MPRPEGYRKALRLMKLAEKFGLPVFTFVDTPGAYPGIGAEERGQSEAIGRNLYEMAELKVPIIVTIIGEGGSGGALAIAVGDQVLMLQYSTYSVISPEGCASILWKSAERAAEAAETLGITAHRLKTLGLIDKIVNEPVGGAHRDPKQMAAFLKRALNDAFRQVSDLPVKDSAAPLRAAAILRPLQRHHRALTTAGRHRSRVVAVAFSGGRDSTALLHATVAEAAPLGLSVLALHVHHGLSANADAWLAHATALCRRWARRGLPVELVARRLDARPAAGESVEAWARRARYRALREMALARGVDLVLLAHHRRDQAETFLLQALRGGGVAALSAMPKVVRRDGITWARPWLEQPREAIDAYARRHRLRWIDDDSNDDDRFARNRLRLRVWPALVEAFADAEGVAGRRGRAHPARRGGGRRDRGARPGRDRR